LENATAMNNQLRTGADKLCHKHLPAACRHGSPASIPLSGPVL
jgi:hypothetical protein